MIEAMKVMNEIVADNNCEIHEICFVNGKIVEFGQALLKIKECSLMELNNKILEEYFSYLTMIKARSPHMISEFRVDLRLLFMFVYKRRKPSAAPPHDCSFADIKFIKSITLDDMYAFVAYLQKERNCSIATCGRKIISIRQF